MSKQAIKEMVYICHEKDLVPKDWADGKEMSVGEWGQREFDSGHKAGVKSGIDRAREFLMEKATEAFRRGLDSEAMNLRALAKELSDQQKATQ